MGGSFSLRVHPFAAEEEEEEGFVAALSEAIRESRLDRIEALIQSPRLPTRLRPLHIAAAYASLEALEILVSAGFRVEAVDSLVRSALHRCATNRSEASALCACFLGSLAPSMLRSQDKDGLTPLDLAVLRRNKGVLSALLHLLGPEELWLVERARTLALKLRHQDLLLTIDSRLSHASEESGGRPDRRTMQVWERFFENALSFAEARDRRYQLAASASQSSANSFENSEIYQRAVSASQGCGEEDGWPYDENRSPDETGVEEWPGEESALTGSADLEALRFCLSCVAVHRNDDLAVLSPRYSYDASLAQHLADYCSPAASAETDEEALPVSVFAAVTAGWVSFFDCQENDAFWYNAFSGRSERHLPVGADYSSLMLEGLSVEAEHFLCPDYSPCYSWAMLLDDDDSSQWSCYNFLTGEC